MKPFCYGILLCTLLAIPAATKAEQYKLASPNGSIEITVDCNDTDGEATYSVSRDGIEIVAPSALGLKLNTTIMNSFSSGVSATTSESNTMYTMPHGKKSVYTNNYKEITLSGTASQPQRNLTVRFRVFDCGVAFRYELENRQGNIITADLSEFNFKNFENSHAQRYHKDYSWYYENRDWTAMTQEAAYNMPILVKCGTDTYTLLTESASTSAMAVSRVCTGDKIGQLLLQPGSNSEIYGTQFISPWRVMIIGNLPQIVESTIITSLNEPTAMANTDWIRPGRVAWNWGAEDGDSAPTTEQAQRYIDFAANMGWEYFLLDDGWDGRIDLSEISAYANERGVDLLIWSHQNRFANDYDDILKWFKYWESLGIKGVKIDFFEDDSQQMMRKYDNMLKAAADCHLMLNFHGCTKPSGLERTWPNLMTSEAVLGGEFYMFNTTMTPGNHTVNLTLTRNVLGSMDYTPVKFGNKKGCVITETTWAYQLALSAAFESALQSICDTPENIIGSIAEPALRELPVKWDDIKCLEANPDNYVTLARRNGDDWWLTSLTNDARDIKVSLDFLDKDRIYYAHIYSNGFHRSDIAYECRQMSASDILECSLDKNSGAMVIFSTNEKLLRPFSVKMEAEKYNRYCSRVNDANCSGGVYLDDIGGSRRMVRFTDVEVPADGVYNITLFYISKGNCDAYIQVNDGDKLYHSFVDNGNRLSFITIPVTLTKGMNTISYGNEGGNAPALDRMVVSRCMQGDDLSSIPSNSIDNMCEIRPKSGRAVEIYSMVPSNLSIYSVSGVRLSEHQFDSGTHIIDLPSAGIYILNLRSNSFSISKKIIIQ